MKLTIHIPDHHAGDVLQFVASLKGAAISDKAPGHPELALGDGDHRPAMNMVPSVINYETRNGCRFELDHINGPFWWGGLYTQMRTLVVKYNANGCCMTAAFASREWDIVKAADE